MIFIRYIQGGRKQQISNRAGNRDYPFAICGKFAFDNVLFIKSFSYHLLRFAPRVASKRREPLARNPTVSAMLSIEILVNSFPFACLQFKENRANDIMTIHLLIHLSLSVTGYLSIRSARISPIPEYNSAEEIRHTNDSKESYRL